MGLIAWLCSAVCQDGPSYDDVNRAVLRHVCKLGIEHYTELSAAIGSTSMSDVEHNAQAIRSMRTWAQSLPDRRLSRHYLRWLCFFEDDNEAARRELQTGRHRASMAQYDQKMNAIWDRVDRVCLPKMD